MGDRELGHPDVSSARAVEQDGPKMGLLQTPFPLDEINTVAAFGKPMGWDSPTATVRMVMRAFARSPEVRAVIHDLPARVFAPQPFEER